MSTSSVKRCFYICKHLSMPFNGGRWWGGFGLPVSSTGLLTLQSSVSSMFSSMREFL
ncbi:hypothetical protein [Snodgrassella alvi]|uniref:hypothetical protein n=1 Tax=Snodgrassella alvi TaxID=1196083 RepID=UPI001557419C|nr:hypothetical protein [Snodgrassella alvi]